MHSLGGIEKELLKTREVLEERLPMTVQPRAEDLTQYKAETVTALECCVEHPDCKGCPLMDDDECLESLPKRALMTIKQLQKQLEHRAEKRFELTGEDRALIHAMQRCERHDCESCPFDYEKACFHRMRKDVLDLVGRLLAEKGVDIDDL